MHPTEGTSDQPHHHSRRKSDASDENLGVQEALNKTPPRDLLKGPSCNDGRLECQSGEKDQEVDGCAKRKRSKASRVLSDTRCHFRHLDSLFHMK